MKAINSVCFVNTVLYSKFDAGAENVIKIICDDLVVRGASINAISISTEGDMKPPGFFTTYKKIEGANVYFPLLDNTRPFYLKAVFHIIDNFNPIVLRRSLNSGAASDSDVIFTHSLRGLSPSIWKLNNARKDAVKMHYIHDYGLMCASSTMYKHGHVCEKQCLGCSVLTLGRKFMSQKVDIVYGASEYILKKHLEAGFFRNAIARSLEPPLKEVVSSSRDEFVKATRFGYFGRIVPDKGLHRLLSAWSQLTSKPEFHDLQLTVAGRGDGAFFEQMVDQCGRTPGVEYRGFTTPKEFFADIDVLVVPSVWPDPNPLVVVEAYSYGVPVIGSDAGGISSSVVHGLTGLKFSHVDDDSELFSALVAFARGMRVSMAQIAEKVSERDVVKFTDRMGADVVAVLKARCAKVK